MRLTKLVHEILCDHLQDGDFTIDATAGNGHDTSFLANCVGKRGKVIAVDIQEIAIESTRNLLSEKSLIDRVSLRLGNHSAILEQLVKEFDDSIAAIVFNLGYLPGSDKSVKTEAKNTIQALETSTKLLRSSGLISIIAYRAHPGGEVEASSVQDWMTSKQICGWHIKHYEPSCSILSPTLWLAGKP